jgi:hypothetical protein
MTDYFDRVEAQLRAAATNRAIPTPQPSRRRQLSGDVLVAACVIIALAVVGVALAVPRHRTQQTAAGPNARQQGVTANPHTHPWLHELQEHFAVLRGPAPASTAAVRNLMRTYQTDYVRLAGTVAGTHIYFVIIPIRRHHAITSYEMNVIADGGSTYTGGSYGIFPNTIASPAGPVRTYFSIVPDAVKTVRWRFTCPRGRTFKDCRHTPAHTYDVPVHGNLASLPRTAVGLPVPHGYTPAPTRVTWYLQNGSRRQFTNSNTAVPFAGAPAWPHGS